MANICIVLNYNDAEETIRFCSYASQYRCIDKIVIVDNKSTDDSVCLLQNMVNDRIVLLCAESNKGYSAGNNVGLKYVLDNYSEGNVIVSNPDVDVEESDLKDILSLLNNEQIGMSTGLIYTNEKVVSNYAWRLPTAGELLAHNFFTLHKILRNTRHDFYFGQSELSKGVIECNCVPGCFFCLRIDALRKIGLLDEGTFLYGEENLLGWKVHNAGYKAAVSTGSRVVHYGGHSIKKSRTKKKKTREYAEKSLLLYVKEYLGHGSIYCVFFHIIFWIAMREQDCILFILRKLGR